MFPLGTVLFPHALLPLHVFEPRYRALVQHCIGGTQEFGVVLIERGSEVGGGDTRFHVGTLSRIVQAAELPDGRYVLVTSGRHRVRIDEWLPDDPYPRARVRRVPDVVSGSFADSDATQLRDEVQRSLRRVLALQAELGAPARHRVDLVLDGDPVRASFEAASAAPLNPLDAQRLLELDDAGERLERLRTQLAEEAEVLQYRLSQR
ncbi:MAG: LON peptidase substrate-binding domain-containing protein [Actinobacteria bacterium]|nr:LON peptidase substrate-binding domain-containing protein [Actinomycetota bacterium]